MILNVRHKMKQLAKYLLAFLLGSGFALGIVSFTHPNIVIAIREGLHGSSPWSLESFEKINRELPDIVGDRSRSLAVIPRNSGYEITGADLSLFGYFRRTWDRPLELIDTRMTELRNEEQKAEQVVPPNGP